MKRKFFDSKRERDEAGCMLIFAVAFLGLWVWFVYHVIVHIFLGAPPCPCPCPP